MRLGRVRRAPRTTTAGCSSGRRSSVSARAAALGPRGARVSDTGEPAGPRSSVVVSSRVSCSVGMPSIWGMVGGREPGRGARVPVRLVRGRSTARPRCAAGPPRLNPGASAPPHPCVPPPSARAPPPAPCRRARCRPPPRGTLPVAPPRGGRPPATAPQSGCPRLGRGGGGEGVSSRRWGQALGGPTSAATVAANSPNPTRRAPPGHDTQAGRCETATHPRTGRPSRSAPAAAAAAARGGSRRAPRRRCTWGEGGKFAAGGLGPEPRGAPNGGASASFLAARPARPALPGPPCPARPAWPARAPTCPRGARQGRSARRAPRRASRARHRGCAAPPAAARPTTPG
jgi:hypothetical protein